MLSMFWIFAAAWPIIGAIDPRQEGDGRKRRARGAFLPLVRGGQR
jgi:hypothetical protein